MYLRDHKVETATGGFLDTNRYSVGDVSKIIGLLIRQYSNPLRAAIRESLCNAFDANTEAQNKTPVHIYLPTSLHPQIRIVDDGVGLSHAAAMQLYTTVGASTKDTAGNVQIGGFGIGSKAPFAYTRQFSVISRFDGMQRTYLCYLDEHNDPHIAETDRRATDAHNGVEVSFEVKLPDIAKAYKETLDLCQYFDPLPVLHNSSQQPEAPTYAASGQNWGLRAGGKTGSRIIMGGVAYPMDTTHLPGDLQQLAQSGFDVFVPVGTVKPTPSRESIDFTPEAIAKLTAAFSTVRAEILADVQRKVDAAPTLWDAFAVLKATEITGDYYLNHTLRAAVTYKGQKIPNSLQLPLNAEAAYGGSRAFFKIGGRVVGLSVNPSGIEAIYFDDGCDFPIKRLEQLSPKTLVIRPPNWEATTRDDIATRLGNPRYKLLSEVPYVKVKAAPRAKGQAAPRQLYWRLVASQWTGTSSGITQLHPARANRDIYNVPDAPTDPVIYIAITDYRHDVENIRDKTRIGLIQPNEVWFVHSSQVGKLPLGSQSFDEALAERIQAFKDADPDFDRRLFYYGSISSEWSKACRLVEQVKKDTPFAQLKDIHDNVLRGITETHRALFDYLRLERPKSSLPTIQSIIATIKKKQPALTAFVEGYLEYYYSKDMSAKIIMEKLQ